MQLIAIHCTDKSLLHLLNLWSMCNRSCIIRCSFLPWNTVYSYTQVATSYCMVWLSCWRKRCGCLQLCYAVWCPGSLTFLRWWLLRFPRHYLALTYHFHCMYPCAGQLLLSSIQKPEICQHTTAQQNVSIPVTIAALFAPSKPANTYTVVRKNQHIRNQHIPKQSCEKKVQSKETIMQQ